MGEIFAHRRLTGDVPMDRVPLSEKEAGSFLLESGDLLFARQSLVLSGAGKCSIFLGADEPTTFEGHLIRARLDRRQADPAFYFYYFSSRRGRAVIESVVEQVAAAGVRGTDLANLVVPNPPLQEQHAAVAILRAFDDKIDMNRRMNRTLEQLAAALFKSWFIDFDPVRAKMEGRQPFGMETETAALFPDSLATYQLGGMPAGWRFRTLSELATIVMGQSPPGHTYNEREDGAPFFQGSRDFGWRFPSRRVFCTAPARLAERDDILLSVRAPVGEVNVAWEACAIGRGLAAIRPADGTYGFVLYAVKSVAHEWDRFEAGGTVFGSASKHDIETVQILVPNEELVRAFAKTVAPLDSLIRSLEAQSATLTALRDTLLPKLLSGELRVREAERELAAVM